MKKSIVLALVLGVVVSAFAFTGTVYAQTTVNPETVGWGGHGPGGSVEDGNNYVEAYLVEYAVITLGLDAADVQAQLDAGVTLAEIVYNNGVEDYAAFMVDARDYAAQKLAEDGIVIPGWEDEKGNGNSGASMGSFGSYDPENCVYPDSPTPVGSGGQGFRGGRK